jgi:Glycine rich protein
VPRSIQPSRRLGRMVLVLAFAAVAAALSLTRSDTAGATVTTLKKFTTPGTYTWTVPTGVTNVTFDVYGAKGGDVKEPAIFTVAVGGAGGEARGKFAVHAGEVFEIQVGGQGGAATVGVSTGTGGFNGGVSGDTVGAATHVSGGGGGASDVLIGGRGNGCAAAISCLVFDRIIVAGGGGGGSDSGANGDAGGGSTPAACVRQPPEDATQVCPGALNNICRAGSVEPGFGQGGNCVNSGLGGGGGGWFGGGSYNTGGGGSGYISQLSTSGGFPGGTSTGNGKVTITTTT